MPRGSYRTISEDKARILKCFNEGNDFVQLAKILEINRSTAYNIVRANRTTNLPKGGARNKKPNKKMNLRNLSLNNWKKPIVDFKPNDSENEKTISSEA